MKVDCFKVPESKGEDKANQSSESTKEKRKKLFSNFVIFNNQDSTLPALRPNTEEDLDFFKQKPIIAITKYSILI